ncbi:hypothetical protein INR49_011299, partial [Caranx melampygus]
MPLYHVCGVFVFSSICLFAFTPCDGGNILVFPLDGSHWINMKILLEELHARGHNITVIRASNSWYITEKSPLYTPISVEMTVSYEEFFGSYLQEHLRVQREGASLLTFLKLTKDFLSMLAEGHLFWCEALAQMFDDEKMVKSLKDSKYDLVLTDPAIGPGVLLAKYLKLPLVLNVRWIPGGEGHFAIAPTPLSYIPVPGSGLTDKMNFMQRVKNMFFYSIILFQQKFLLGPSYDTICAKYIEGGCEIISLLQEADIWLFRSDFVFDFPRPTMPNIVYIGGFQCKPAQPLPADLEEFVQGAGKHGVIIMTLGTTVNALPKEVTDEIASVFARMPQKVIWRHKGDRPSTLGNNTLIVDWMPQKDLLGHPQIKVFVAHGGTNGVQEAIYHGVPVLGIPLFFDQYDNLLRLQERGAGKILQFADVSGCTFEQGLKEVLHQDSYRQNMQRLSRLHRDQPIPPMDQAIFWVQREGASALTFFKMTKDFLSMLSYAHSISNEAHAQMFDNEKMVKSLKDSKYDLVLTDPAIGPGALLAKYLKLPLVLNVRWIPGGEGHFAIAPTPLSYIPVPGSGLTDKMNFMQRVKNMFFYSIILFQQKFLLGPSYDAICAKYIEGGCEIISLLQEADIWLFRSDFVFDFPRPTMPNIVYIGGFQCKPAQPLPADLEEFVQGAGEHGVIIMTLGSLVNALPKEVTDEIASVFARMPQKVIWRHKGDRPSTLGNNTLIVDWMPQKDLLGHPQIKVFVAHGGTNGVQEAIYHGVPVLGIPLFFDQYDNLLRLQERGAGKILQFADVSGCTFEQGLKEVLHQDSYRQNMQKLSRLHRDQPIPPMDQAIFWVQREGASALTFLKMTKDFLSMLSEAHSVWNEALAQMFDNEKMVKSLKDSKYDLVLTDPAIAQGVLLAKYLKLPLVLNVRWIPGGEGHFAIAPTPLSYIPVPGSGLTDKMNFMQRVKNMFFYSIILFQQKFLLGPSYDAICAKYIEGGCEIISLLQEADIWLFRSNFVFDFPRPTMPNIVYIGGFQCKPAQPLPADLEEFVQGAGEHGVIIMTLGTLVNALPKEVTDEIASVFARMPQKVIWRHKGDRPSTLGNNTLIVDWMPQKDLLGHPQIKVFVAHGGTNGVQEAIYHGVPVLGIPLFFDQYDNLLRLQERGAGKILQFADVNGRTFEQGLKEVLHQDSYRQNMQRLSRLHRDQPILPMDQAIFWVEYVMRHKGAPHLRSEAYKMPWYSYYCFYAAAGEERPKPNNTDGVQLSNQQRDEHLVDEVDDAIGGHDVLLQHHLDTVDSQAVAITADLYGGEVIRDIQDVLDGVSYSADDPIDHMHHSVCGHLVTVDDPGTMVPLYQFLHVLKYFFLDPWTCCRAHTLGLREEGWGEDKESEKAVRKGVGVRGGERAARENSSMQKSEHSDRPSSPGDGF